MGTEMQTDRLIAALQADRRPPAAALARLPLAAAWWLAGGLALLLAGAVFFATIGPRPDILNAAQTPRFLFKFVVTLALAGAAFAAVRVLSRPEGRTEVLRGLAAAPVLLALAVVLELIDVPAGEWSGRLIGMNNTVCLTYIPLIGIGPLAVFIAAQRHGAPARPVLAGALAGVLAGGLAATFYAAHCSDDSPLFVIVWYTLAIAGLGAAGALMARLFVRW